MFFDGDGNVVVVVVVVVVYFVEVKEAVHLRLPYLTLIRPCVRFFLGGCFSSSNKIKFRSKI